MKKYKSIDMIKAYNAGGYRERFAMDNGNKTVLMQGNNILWRFTYSKYNSYQDANGATYNVTLKKWVN